MPIPRIIHYCWFGGNEKPEIIRKCISSWKKYCPDYEIKEWNESNFDINMFQYTKEAYNAKKWAFVSDVARLWVVLNYGGIYMDTDVEVLNNIDSLLNNDLFMFFESERSIASGLGFGATKNNEIIKELVNDYSDRPFLLSNGKHDLTACPAINTKTIRKLIPSLELNGRTQHFDNSIAFFSPGDYQKLMHHYGAGSWTNNPKSDFSQKEWKDTKLKSFLRKPSRMSYLENHLPKKLFSFYVFISYDLLEYGLIYLIKYLFNKITKSE